MCLRSYVWCVFGCGVFSGISTNSVVDDGGDGGAAAGDAYARPSIMRLLRKFTGNNGAHPPGVGVP